MLTVISPAKKLDETAVVLPDGLEPTQPVLAAQAVVLAKLAKGLSEADLCRLMAISPSLARLNRERFDAFRARPGPGDVTPAAFLFAGDTYAGLEVRGMHPDALRWAQGHLRILSGLYGLLRPLDAIQPYRLEMGSRLENARGADLYAFWGDRIARALNKTAAEVGAKVLLNCASAEYFGAVDLGVLRPAVVTPVFLEDRDGAAKIVSFWAKKARGAMARFVADNHLTDPADLRGFGVGGYAFRADLSDGARMVFLRAGQDRDAAAA